MTIENFLPLSFDWNNIPTQKVNGETGFSTIKTQTLGEITIRHIEYSNNYTADHWCEKGHIVFIIQGELIIEHKDNSIHSLKSGMTYLIGDNTLAHKAKSEFGAKALIID